MNKRKKLKRPKTKQGRRLAKKRIARSLKNLRKKSNIPRIIPNNEGDFISAIKRTPSGLRTYEAEDSRFKGVDSYDFTLQDFQWQGLLTLKFHSYSHSKDDHKGDGRKNRFDFLTPFMDNLRIKLGISDREFNWFACEEFGFTGAGHLHIIFSFDYLKEKNRMDRIKISDFSENGHFFQEGRETVEFICRNLRLNPGSVDFHWRPMWENEGLVNYFCKLEDGREPKMFNFSDFWKKRGLLKAA